MLSITQKKGRRKMTTFICMENKGGVGKTLVSEFVIKRSGITKLKFDHRDVKARLERKYFPLPRKKGRSK
jgi:hypothetical protein